MLNDDEGAEMDLQYADIIQIRSKDKRLDQQDFFIDYIDLGDESDDTFEEKNQPKIRLLSLKDYSQLFSFPINNRRIDDENISSIRVLSRSPVQERGYIRHNQFQEKQRIFIEWDTDWVDIPPNEYTIREIASEHDAMEIVDKNKETLYIDFAFKGLPFYILNIKPTDRQEDRLGRQEGKQDMLGQEDRQDMRMLSLKEDRQDRLGQEKTINQLTLEGDQWIHDYYGEVEEDYGEEDRMTWEAQLQDFADSLDLQDSPPHIKASYIQRFAELRRQFSTFELEGTITPIHNHPQPFLKVMDKFPHHWIYPVVNLKKHSLFLQQDELDLKDPLFKNPHMSVESQSAWLKDVVVQNWEDYTLNKNTGIEVLTKMFIFPRTIVIPLG